MTSHVASLRDFGRLGRDVGPVFGPGQIHGQHVRRVEIRQLIDHHLDVFLVEFGPHVAREILLRVTGQECFERAADYAAARHQQAVGTLVELAPVSRAGRECRLR